jgi:hypothetical protein
MFLISDGEADPSGSCLTLSEDGVDLGPPHAAHQLIEQEGRGRFSHWKDGFRFAASDSSDPNSNGRTYEVARTRHCALIATFSMPSILSTAGHAFCLEVSPALWGALSWK